MRRGSWPWLPLDELPLVTDALPASDHEVDDPERSDECRYPGDVECRDPRMGLVRAGLELPRGELLPPDVHEEVAETEILDRVLDEGHVAPVVLALLDEVVPEHVHGREDEQLPVLHGRDVGLLG